VHREGNRECIEAVIPNELDTWSTRMDDIAFYYFAYGSNLPYLRMLERTSNNISPKGKFAWGNQRLAFSKKSDDGSAKCTAVATSNEHNLWGAIYQVNYADKQKLVQAEGGYHEVALRFPVDGELKLGFTFVANADRIDPYLFPYTWYKRYVLAGAKEHKFPSAYIAAIEAVQARPDPKRERATRHEPLLSQIESALKFRTGTP
jgi:AIG2-like family